MIDTDLDARKPSSFAIDLPVVPGSDEITIDAAEMSLVPLARTIARAPAANGGTISFPEEVRLKSVELTALAAFGDGNTDDRLVVGPADGGPVYAFHSFGAGLYGQLLGGMSVESPAADHHVANFPPLTGTSFRVQLAKGKSPTELGTLRNVTVTRASLDAAPTALAVTMRVGDIEAPVWSHPGTLLPGTSQEVSFLPVVERLLKTPPAAKPNASLVFLSTTDGKVSIPRYSIGATYVARPAGQPRKIALRGGWERMPLDAPKGIRPTSSALTISAKFLGRTLNAASEAAMPESPATSVRFDTTRSVAALAPFASLAGSPPGSPLAIAGVRLFLAALSNAEVVVELRANAGGAPAVPIAPQSVLQLAAGEFGWREIVLPSPPPSIATGTAALWVLLRTTKGEALWCADARVGAPALASTEGMQTWSDVGAPAVPRLQLFHAAVTPESIEVHLRAKGIFHKWTLARSAAGSPNFSSGPTSLPVSLHKLLQRTSGETPRATTPVELFSPHAADLTVDGIALSYRVNATLKKS